MKKHIKYCIIGLLIILVIVCAVQIIRMNSKVSFTLNGNDLQGEASALTIGGKKYISAEDISEIFKITAEFDKDKVSLTTNETFDLQITSEEAIRIADSLMKDELGAKYIRETDLYFNITEDGNFEVQRYPKPPKDPNVVSFGGGYKVLVGKYGQIIEHYIRE